MIRRTYEVVSQLHNSTLTGSYDTACDAWAYIAKCQCGAHSKYMNRNDAMKWIQRHRWLMQNRGPRDIPVGLL